MKQLSDLALTMRDDWDRRVQHDYRFWITNELSPNSVVWEDGGREFAALVAGLNWSRKPLAALEIGCGVGRMLPAARAVFDSVIGVDVSPKVVAKAKELVGARPGVVIDTNSGFDLSGIESGSIDFAWSVAVMPHLPARVFASYLCELKRVLRADGAARIQIFIGRQDPPSESDTLRLRAYGEDELRYAITRAGLELRELAPIAMPLQELLDELELRPLLVTLAPSAAASHGFEEVAEALLPNGAEPEMDRISCTEFEAWLALHYADKLYSQGEFDRARSALEYVSQHCRAAGTDTKDILERIERIAATNQVQAELSEASADNRYYTANIEVVNRRFPEVARALSQVDPSKPINLRVAPTADGPVLWVGETCLDHAEKPVLAAAAWVKRSLNDPRLAKAEHLICVGFGCGYHLESLLAQGRCKVTCVEPEIEVLKAALTARDLRALLERLESLECVASPDQVCSTGDTEVVVRPQSVAIHGQDAQKIANGFYAKRGLTQLRPKIAVLGPLQGGTLPIGHYCVNALQRLGQRARGIDMSGFNSAYEGIAGLLAQDQRRNAARHVYVETLSSLLLESFAEKPVDILICMAQAPISARALTELRRQGVITVLWFVEDYLRFTYWREMAKYYDFVFTIQKGECLEAIKQAGAGETHYLPTACDPRIHAPAKLTEAEIERWGSPLSFVGAGYHNRREMFASLAHYPFKIWGTEWPGCKPFDKMVQEEGRRLTPEEYTKIFNSSAINLNLHSSNERDGVDPSGDFLNPRTFELAACGAFQLVDQRSLLGECFEPGREIVTFDSLGDLREKIDFYLAHPERRAGVIEAARARVLRDHTYDKRMESMLSVIYTSAYQRLRQRAESSPWSEMIKRAEFDPELKQRCERAYSRGEEPILDGLIADIATGNGQLTETEQKLLFLFHVRKQIIRMEKEGAGVRN
jgi:spore maturation protein CgeB